VRRTHPALAVVGIFFHGGMMFLLPLIVGLIASMLLDVSEVAETSLGLAIGAAVVVGPAFLAILAGVGFKTLQELSFLRQQRTLNAATFVVSLHRHLALITLQGYAVLGTGLLLVILSLGFQWASLGVLAVLSLVLFYWVVGASVFLSAFMVRTFRWGLDRRRSGIRREMAPAVVRTGEAVEERFHLTKVPVFPGYRLLIHDRLPARLDTESRYVATPSASRETVTLAGLVRRTPRGRYRVGPATIQYQDALGLTRVAVAALATAELTVLPRVRPVRIVDPPRSVDESPDLLTILHRFASEDYYRFRAYVPGDDTRRIHWKLSMRAGRLQVRLPESKEISHRKIVLALDSYLPRNAYRARPVMGNLLDALVEAWVSLTDGLVRDGEQVTLVTAAPGPGGAAVVERYRCKRGTGAPWRELGARVGWQPWIDLAQLFADEDEDVADLVVLSSRFASPPPGPLPGRRVTWIYLPPEAVLDPPPPGWFDRWMGEGRRDPLHVLRRMVLLPHTAGSSLNGPIRRSYDFAKILNRDSQVRVARRHAILASHRVMAALAARPDALYQMEVGSGHYVLRGVKGLTIRGHGRGVA
jgi:uncharacterized protein (DUF58 family)